MKLSDPFTAVSSVMTRKLGTALAVGAVAMCLLLGAGMAHALTVERDGANNENVSAIRDLELGGLLYDVEFLNYPAASIYPGNPPNFDFDTSEEAGEAHNAVIAVLNAEGGVSEVGRSTDSGVAIFRIAYAFTEKTINFNFWFFDINQQIRFVAIWEAVTDNPDLGSTNWINANQDLWPYLDDGSYAQFTVVGTAGTGNLPPDADAGGPYAGAVGDVISFDGSVSSDPDGTIMAHNWDFGDGNTGTGETPSHTYGTAGIYNISLTVTDDSGVVASDSSTAEIGSTSQPPVADAGGPYTGTVGAPVSFDGTASSDPEGPIVTHSWDFGDGGIASGATQSHTYTASGNYNVTLIVTDNSGETATDVSTAQIAVGNQPPRANAGAPVTGVVAVAVSFDGTGSSDSDGTIMAHNWDFGDGNTGTGATLSHTYSTPDNYIVTLTVTDDGGAIDSTTTAAAIDATSQPPVADAGGPYTGTVGAPVSFDGMASSDPEGPIVTYSWDFGDGGIGTGVTPSYPYTASGNYNVTLIVTDDSGETATDFSTVAIDSPNQSPVANANGPYSGIVDAPVTFSAGGSSDPDGNIVRLTWDFGDGFFGSGEIPSHTYTAVGDYFVILTATDNDGATDQVGAFVFIGAGNQPPHADAGGPYKGAEGVAISFDGTDSSDPDGTIAAHDWDFGDGTFGSGRTTSHSYAAAGIYLPVLTVTDNDGAIDQIAAYAFIGSSSQLPTANAGGPYGGTVGVAVNFTSMGTSDPDGDIIVDYDWNFGDDTPIVSEKNPTHIYSAPGPYNVTLTVTDFTGETDTDSTNALIGVGNLPPKADAGPVVATVIGQEVSFDGTGSSGENLQYDWYYGDGTSDTDVGPTPSHTYTDVDRYNVTLTVTDDAGATDSDSTVARIVTEDINLPPVKPILKFPADGSDVDLEGKSSLDLKWLRSKDPNGDDVSYRVHVCIDSDPLTNCPSTVVASLNPLGQGNVLYASVLPVDISKKSDWRTIALMGVLSCMVLMGFAWKNRRPLLMLMLLIFSVAIIVNCGDSGGGGGGGGGDDDEATFSETGLSSNKTYYWTVVAEDDQGESSVSDVWSFTTR